MICPYLQSQQVFESKDWHPVPLDRIFVWILPCSSMSSYYQSWSFIISLGHWLWYSALNESALYYRRCWQRLFTLNCTTNPLSFCLILTIIHRVRMWSIFLKWSLILVTSRYVLHTEQNIADLITLSLWINHQPGTKTSFDHYNLHIIWPHVNYKEQAKQFCC